MYEEIIHVPPQPDSPFTVQMAGISYCDGSYLIDRPNSRVHCLEYIVSGTGTVQEDGKIFTASQGDVYLLHRGRHQHYYSDSADPWVKIWMNVCGPLSDRLITLYSLDHVNHIPNATGMEAPFRAFVDNARNRHKQAPGCHPEALLFHTVILGLADILRMRKSTHTPALAAQVKQAIDRAPNYRITLEEIAQTLFCSKSHAIKVFHEAYGIPPYAYILQQKTQLAMLLLQNSSLSIGQIADMLGFCDSHYFSGFFKSRVGVPPRQYRRCPGEIS